ncbi:uncharacterized protein LOC111386757 isoform X7 [Olea europaea var. sylvestris]|uniref:uncharacterized protein LOC111386757 isoform X7 n=1 Tax=Olea europaea var. sylvestris TaxID=158386 RepID=UPI000C1D6E6C|nr:uncharacterized protein LOC111386757 isoform X7 [Olea europaea var. sylvestris]
MSLGNISMIGHKDIEIQRQSLDFASSAASSVSENVKGKDHIQDQETMVLVLNELYLKARSQEMEILYLREQIALASIKESLLLNEKHALERKFSELRMILDEKQNEAITSASNELARRKGDLEVNLNLLNELKVAENEKHILMSSMLGMLGEYGVWPHVTNASALTNSIKNLHDQLQLKIRTSHDVHGFSHYNQYVEGQHSEPTSSVSRYVQGIDATRMTMSNTDRNFAGHTVDNLLDRNELQRGSEQWNNEQSFHQPTMGDGVASFSSDEEGPGIEGFQIIGEAKPGCKLLGCGYPVRGTSLCMFQWVRHYPDGTRHYIEGATNPEYVVTADDVDKLIAVECIPMDEQGRQGYIVRIFANDHNKITCDEEMQEEIDTYLSEGQATFSVQTLIQQLDSSEIWEPTTVLLWRSGFQVKVDKTQAVLIAEKYSKDVLIKIPVGLSTQFVLTCSNGSSYPFSTNKDIRMRETLVLTMRIFQSKALDEKRKGA